jgi:hypothetical protein
VRRALLFFYGGGIAIASAIPSFFFQTDRPAFLGVLLGGLLCMLWGAWQVRQLLSRDRRAARERLDAVAAFQEAVPTLTEPTTRAEVDALTIEELAECSPDLRAYFSGVRIVPEKWKQSPYGDLGGGFWVAACDGKRVLWWNDIEEGWNVSEFETRGTIPDDQYWCNQDPLNLALPVLSGAPGITAGPPQPLPDRPLPPS